ncbi:phosphotransferase [Streptomyces olivochromogenes]|uniref:phosphotransferase n=1 Tax=Streptomyces olivochromogenes TaxID=1963 RepID=UPI0036BE3D9F
MRLPWATRSADALLRKEYAWLPSLAPRLPLQVPVPQRLGEPSERFPRPWIVTTWVPGAPADHAPATNSAEAADTLANILTADGTFCGVIDFGGLCAGDPACDLAASWVHLPDGAADRFHDAYRPAPDAATLRRARGWAVLQALGGILIGEAGHHSRPGGKPTWGPPAHAALRRLTAQAR